MKLKSKWLSCLAVATMIAGSIDPSLALEPETTPDTESETVSEETTEPVLETEQPETYVTGYQMSPNTDFAESDALYQVTFTYVNDEAQSGIPDASIEKIVLAGNFQFFWGTEEELEAFTNNDYAKITAYRPEQYQKGMFSTGYDFTGSTEFVMEKVEGHDGVYTLTMPLPSGEYYYGFNIYDGSVDDKGNAKATKVLDESNLPVVNTANGHDSGWSLLWVGKEGDEDAVAGQEYIFPEEHGYTGTVHFDSYIAVDGTEQPMGVYLPYGYDTNKTYKTLYLSHGGGGNEVEWHYIGAGQNIMDNLIADGEVEETIVITLDHTYFKWNYDDIKANLMDHVIPYVESHYSVSTEAKDRAFAGLSMGGLTTTSVYSTLADEFGYLGIWSATNGNLDVAAVKHNADPVLMLAAGCFDFGKGGYPALMAKMDEAGVDYTYEQPGGAHDWGVWRHLLTSFAKNYLWEEKPEKEPTTGYTISGNADYPDSDALYQVTFTYVNDEQKSGIANDEIEKIVLAGNFQFFEGTESDLAAFDANDYSQVKAYGPEAYKKGMFTTGYDFTGTIELVMDKLADGVYQLTIPVPSGEYYYGFNIYDGTVNDKGDPVATKVLDESNLPVANPANGHDSGWSLLWIGNASNPDVVVGQEMVFPRTDGQTGTVEFGEYLATDGTIQPLSIYLPYQYDPEKTYKTLYISHGGGGNEVEWMYIGAAQNIMDNLIAEGEVEETIVVAMDNTYFGWAEDLVAKNIVENIIPYIEANYSVSPDARDRAFSGLSMGGGVATQVFAKYPGEFGYIGIWSGTYPNTDFNTVNKLYPTMMIGCGVFDFAKPGFPLLMENFDGEGIAYTYHPVGGAHCWGTWRSLLTIFARDYLWEDTDKLANPTQPDGPVVPEEPIEPEEPDTPVEPVTPPTNVNTGDQLNIMPMVVSAAAAFLVLSALVYKKKKLH